MELFFQVLEMMKSRIGISVVIITIQRDVGGRSGARNRILQYYSSKKQMLFQIACFLFFCSKQLWFFKCGGFIRPSCPTARSEAGRPSHTEASSRHFGLTWGHPFLST